MILTDIKRAASGLQKKQKVVAYAFGKRFRKVSRESENSRSTAWKTVPTVEDIQNS